MKYKIKTIDINAKQWFDKINGNSYFSSQITLNYSLPTQINIKLPFDYGYGSYYEHSSIQKLIELGYLPKDSEYNYFKNNKIILRSRKESNCLKSTVKNWGI